MNPIRDKRLYEARKLIGNSDILDLGAGLYSIGGLKVDIQITKRPDVCASGLQLPFKDGAFDKVVCLEMIEHLEKNDQKQALNEIRRVARREVVISIPNSSSFMIIPQKIVWWIRERTTQREYHDNHMTHTHIGLISPNELLCLMISLGFDVVIAKRIMLYDYLVKAMVVKRAK